MRIYELRNSTIRRTPNPASLTLIHSVDFFFSSFRCFVLSFSIIVFLFLFLISFSLSLVYWWRKGALREEQRNWNEKSGGNRRERICTYCSNLWVGVAPGTTPRIRQFPKEKDTNYATRNDCLRSIAVNRFCANRTCLPKCTDARMNRKGPWKCRPSERRTRLMWEKS